MPNSLTDLKVPSIKQVDAEKAPMAVAVASLITSIACSDGILTPREYAAGIEVAEAVAGLSNDPAVVRSLTLRAFDVAPRPIEGVLKDVVSSRSDMDEPTRRHLIEALFPLLATQGKQARPLARQVGEALGVPVTGPMLDAGQLLPESSGMAAMMQYAGNIFSQSSSKLDVAMEVAQFTGDEELARVLRLDRRERDRYLDTAIADSFVRLQSTLTALHNAHQDHHEKVELAQSMERNADALERQFKARLHAIEKRIMMLRRHIKEDVEVLSEDGGEEAEVDLRRMSEKRGLLLRNDDRDVRERMVAKGLARRHDRLKRRYDEQIQLLRDELAEYRDDSTAAAQDSVISVSLAEWRIVVPGPTMIARVKDALDEGATRTLAGGAVAAAGAVGAVGAGWVAPAAVAGAVAAPVGLAVLGVVAAAGVWKLYANRDERLRGEQRARVEAIRKAAQTKAQGAFVDVSIALDEVAEGFREVGLSQIAPLRHSAERIREMCALQTGLARRISGDAQCRLRKWKQLCAPANGD